MNIAEHLANRVAGAIAASEIPKGHIITLGMRMDGCIEIHMTAEGFDNLGFDEADIESDIWPKHGKACFKHTTDAGHEIYCLRKCEIKWEVAS